MPNLTTTGRLWLPQQTTERESRAILDAVDDLQMRHSHELGFLPRAALEQAWQDRRLWIGHEGNDVVGYTLFSMHKHVLTSHQTVIEEPLRRDYRATELIAGVCQLAEYKGVREIKIKVADDLPANDFWRTIGFKRTRTKKGGKRSGRRIHHYRMAVRDRRKLAQRLIDHLTKPRKPALTTLPPDAMLKLCRGG